ncbi:MAG TPA: hypothetical protein VEX13_00360 [Chloroflexia bacterium]|nr:hypothetical protein [Chloroflexia bacterium]
MDDLTIDLLASMIWAIVGVIGAFLARWIWIVQPSKRLWNLFKPENVTLVAATTHKELTPEGYERLSTGLGEFRALNLITASLNLAYRNIKIQNILLSNETVQDRIENDLVLLGGPVKNRLTKAFLESEQIEALNIAHLDRAGIHWRANGAQEDFQAEIEDSKVVHDYGLIISTANPLCENGTRSFMFAGCHTYGTVAAAKYFTTDYLRIADKFGKVPSPLFIVVKCDVRDEYPVNIRCWRIYPQHKRACKGSTLPGRALARPTAATATSLDVAGERAI